MPYNLRSRVKVAPELPPSEKDVKVAKKSPPPKKKVKEVLEPPRPRKKVKEAPEPAPPKKKVKAAPESPPPKKKVKKAAEPSPPEEEVEDLESPPPKKKVKAAPESPPPKKKVKKAAEPPPPEEKVEDLESTPPKKEPKLASESPEPKKEPEVAPESPPPKKEVKKVGITQFMFGSDSCGELGLGKIGISRKNPVKLPVEESIKQVACGPMHTLSLTETGKVYSYGCNDEGALGRVTDEDESLEAIPTIVELDAKVSKITAGDSHSAVLTINNEVFVWGNFRDEHGSVGLTPSCDGKPSYKPIKLLPNKKFTDIASGSNHMLLLDTDGKVYSFGVGAQGQLGRIKPDDISGDNGATLKISAENRELFLTPQEVSLKDVDKGRPFVCDAIYAGNFSSFATNTDKKKNRLAAWGLNNYYQLGYKGQKGQLVQYFARRSTFTCSTSMIGVACGQHHTLFLTKTGRVYAAGRHEYGMLGLGKKSKEVCPAEYIQSLPPTTTISAGINTSFAVTTEGQLFAWGMSGSSLGVDTEDDLIVPTEVKSLEGKKVVSVSVGGSFTSVLVE